MELIVAVYDDWGIGADGTQPVALSADRKFFRQTTKGAMVITGTGTEHYRIVCLKSANHFRGFFQPRADAIVTADPPGLRCSDLTTYNYRNMRSPLYPLDENTTFMGE